MQPRRARTAQQGSASQRALRRVCFFVLAATATAGCGNRRDCNAPMAYAAER